MKWHPEGWWEHKHDLYPEPIKIKGVTAATVDPVVGILQCLVNAQSIHSGMNVPLFKDMDRAKPRNHHVQQIGSDIEVSHADHSSKNVLK